MRGPTGPKLAARARSLEISPTVAMAAKARALRARGVRVLDFTVGEPDQPTPPHVVAAGKAAVDAGRTKYAPASGLPELRSAVVHRYREDFAVSFAPEDVCVAVGGKQALALLYQAILDRGSEVVVPAPAWPTFAEAARVAGATPVFVTLGEKSGFRLTARAVAGALTPRTRAVAPQGFPTCWPGSASRRYSLLHSRPCNAACRPASPCCERSSGSASTK